MTEILAGALTGTQCSQPGKTALCQGMLSIFIDPARSQPTDEFFGEVNRYVDFVKSAKTIDPTGEILVPGDIERSTRNDRTTNGIPLDDKTWSQIVDCARSLGIAKEVIDAVGVS